MAPAPDGVLIVIELKRARTPCDVVSRTLDYACRAESLEADNLGQAFHDRFGRLLDRDTLNQSHQIVIVASSLDAASLLDGPSGEHGVCEGLIVHPAIFRRPFS